MLDGSSSADLVHALDEVAVAARAVEAADLAVEG